MKNKTENNNKKLFDIEILNSQFNCEYNTQTDNYILDVKSGDNIEQYDCCLELQDVLGFVKVNIEAYYKIILEHTEKALVRDLIKNIDEFENKIHNKYR